MALALVLALARAREEPPLSVLKVQALFYYLDRAKSKFERLAVGMMTWVNAFSKLNPALASMVIFGIVIYAACMCARFLMWIVMVLLDFAVGTQIFEALIDLMEGLNKRVLSALPGLNGILGLLMVFSIVLGWLNITTNIIVNSRLSRINSNKMSTILYHRSKMIGALPKGKYGHLRRSDDDLNGNDSSASSCAICLGCFGEEDGIRILPNCRHYFHISCIDRWLLPCTVNNSSCPLCRATIISSGLQSSEVQ